MEERLKAYGVRAGFAEDCAGDVIEIVDGCSVTHRNARPGRVFWAETAAIIVKVAWEAQIPAETAGRADLVNYERNEVRAQFAWDF